MAACFVRGSWRPLGAGLLLACLASPAALGQPGVVFVGDGAPTATAGKPLPSLNNAGPNRLQLRGAGDPRYLNSRQVQAAGGVTRADYARAISQQITEAESKPKRGFLSRLSFGFGGGEQPDPAPAPPAQPIAAQAFAAQPFAAPPRAGAVQPAAYVDDTARAAGVLDSAGARERTGLFSWGRKANATPSRQAARVTKPSPQKVASSRAANRRQTNKSMPVAKKLPAPKKRFAGASAGQQPTAKKLAAKPSAPTGRRMPEGPVVFATDPPATTRPQAKPNRVASQRKPAPPAAAPPSAEERLPRPKLIATPTKKPVARKPLTASLKSPATPTVEAKGPAAGAVNPAPIAKSAPVVSPEEALLKTPAVRRIPPRPSKPAKIASRPAAPSNPVPPPAATQSGPTPRAVEILAQANALAQRSQTEADFSLVAQHCRHVQAIDNSPAADAYSRQLAAWALNKRGETRADAGRRDEAMTDFNDALAMDPTRWRAIHNRGVLLAQAGSFAEAFEAFNQTLRHNPRFAKAYSNRAALFVQAGDFAAAMEDYRRAIEANPDLAIAHKGQGRVCHMLGKMDQALRHLDAAALLSPQDASVLSCRADLLVDMGRYAAAAESYRSAIAVDPQMPAAYRNLAWLQATCPENAYRDAASAVANATQALELAGVEDDISLDTLAAAQAASGDFESAATTLRKAIAIAPAGDQAVYAERLSLYQSGKPFTSSPVEDVQQAGYDRLIK